MTTPRRNPKVRQNAKLSIPNFHYGEMKEIARLKTKHLIAKFGLASYTTKEGKRFWFKDNGSKVLFVAHTDSVQTPGVFQPVRFKGDTWVFSPTHDDRLGIYVGLCYLPKANVKVDILLTEGEESGESTALWFDPPKKYNWMFMFDRRGTGCVLYKYGSEQLRYKLGKHNFDIGQGLYSCISELEHLGCSGINFGVGYYDYHNEEAFASMNDLRHQLRKFIDFYNEYKFVSMPHEIGYERFAQAVTYHSWEDKQSKQKPLMIGPKVKVIVKSQKLKKFKKETVTLAEVDTDGNVVGWKQERFISKLYWPIDVINHDVSIINILRNTFKCNFIYDVAQLSPYRLVTSGYMTASDADKVVLEIEKLGFRMPYNVAGFKKADKWEFEKAYGWKSRGETMHLSSIEKKPMKTNERFESFPLALAAEEKVIDKKVTLKKHIVLYPLSNMENVEKMIGTSRGLIKQGYKLECHFKCKQCKTDNIFDIMVHDTIPKFCSNCQAKAEKQSSSTAIKETEAEVITKIQLRKDPNDDTIFELNRKSKGKGIDKYHWIRPVQQPSEGHSLQQGQIGFVASNSD